MKKLFLLTFIALVGAIDIFSQPKLVENRINKKIPDISISKIKESFAALKSENSVIKNYARYHEKSYSKPLMSSNDNIHWYAIQFQNGEGFLSAENGELSYLTTKEIADNLLDFWYFVEDEDGDIEMGTYDRENELFLNACLYFGDRKFFASSDYYTPIAIEEGTSSGWYEIRVAGDISPDRLNQWEGAGIGRQIGLWYQGDPNNQLRFIPLEEYAGVVTLDKTSATLFKGETLQLTATKSPSDMSVAWTSSNTSVATVSNTGLVTAKGTGTATITVASTTASAVKATCTITVKAGSVSLNNTSATLNRGETLQLTATKSPSNMSVAWNSSNTSVATVSNTGFVTAKGAGTATITVASTTDPSVKATCTITVKAGSISLNKTSATLAKGETLQLTATKSPSNMSVTWTSSNTSVATVSKTGLVTGVGGGTAIIKVANSNDPTISATCEVKVNGMTIETDGETILKIGDAKQLSVSGYSGNVQWSISDKSVATITSTGLVRAVGTGSTIVTAQATGDPNNKATCLVDVMANNIIYVGKIYYRLEDSNAIVTNAIGDEPKVDYPRNDYKGTISIPSTINYSGRTYNVTEIDSYTFYNMRELQALSIPTSIKKINPRACKRSQMLARVIFNTPAQSELTLIDKEAFYECTGLTSFSAPSALKEIGDDSFYGCSSLSQVVLSNSVNKIGNRCFKKCTSLVDLTLSNALPIISQEAFSECSSLPKVEILSGTTTINGKAFYNCTGLQKVIISDKVTGIRPEAFRYCTSLTDLTLSKGLGVIENLVFADCSGLPVVEIPGNIHTIEKEAFRRCSSMQTINFSEGLNMINEYAFADCSSLSSLKFPQSLSSVQNYGFAYDTSLQSVEIPEKLQGIGAYCFTDCMALKSIEFKTSIDELTIGSNAFKGCNSLNRVDVKQLDAWVKIAFEDEMANPLALGHNLYRFGKLDTDPVIPAGANFINNFAFYGCTSIRSICIPSTVDFINDNIFYGCTNLKTVKCFATMPPAFLGQRDPAEMNNVFNNATLYVPTSVVSQYKSDSWWGRFKSIQGNNEQEPNAINAVRIDGIEPRGLIYNTKGQRINQGKGLYINNGRKILKY